VGIIPRCFFRKENDSRPSAEIYDRKRKVIVNGNSNVVSVDCPFELVTAGTNSPRAPPLARYVLLAVVLRHSREHMPRFLLSCADRAAIPRRFAPGIN
jgi:hypothetical protein